LSEEHKDEKSYPSRKPILVEGEVSEPRFGDRDEEGRLTTADLANAGEGRGMQDEALEEKTHEERVETRRAGSSTSEGPTTPLFSPQETGEFRSRWDAIQVGFVDEPRHSVEQADQLVAETVKRLAQIFADERTKLEEQWSRGDQVSTEDLRLALQRYRSFFGRLLAV
jgi:hypothetical protein